MRTNRMEIWQVRDDNWKFLCFHIGDYFTIYTHFSSTIHMYLVSTWRLQIPLCNSTGNLTVSIKCENIYHFTVRLRGQFCAVITACRWFIVNLVHTHSLQNDNGRLFRFHRVPVNAQKQNLLPSTSLREIMSEKLKRGKHRKSNSPLYHKYIQKDILCICTTAFTITFSLISVIYQSYISLIGNILLSQYMFMFFNISLLSISYISSSYPQPTIQYHLLHTVTVTFT